MSTIHQMCSSKFVTVAALVAFFTSATLFNGCNRTRKVSDRDVTSLSMTDANELVKGKDGFFGIGNRKAILVDPRMLSDYIDGHIPGAVNLPLGSEIEKGDSRLKNANVLIVYGDDYESPLAKAMAKRLLAAGYDDVRTLQGGLKIWKENGGEVVEGAAAQ